MSFIVKIKPNAEASDLKHIDRQIVAHNESKTVYIKLPVDHQAGKVLGTKPQVFAKAWFSKGQFNIGSPVKQKDW